MSRRAAHRSVTALHAIWHVWDVRLRTCGPPSFRGSLDGGATWAADALTGDWRNRDGTRDVHRAAQRGRGGPRPIGRARAGGQAPPEHRAGLGRGRKGLVRDRQLRHPMWEPEVERDHLRPQWPPPIYGGRSSELEGAPHHRRSGGRGDCSRATRWPLSLLAPIPPATITFHARAITHPAGSVDLATVSKELESLVPKERRAASVLELVPEGAFLTYGIATSLLEMRHPETAMAHVPVG